jgi:hypothetical protein
LKQEDHLQNQIQAEALDQILQTVLLLAVQLAQLLLPVQMLLVVLLPAARLLLKVYILNMRSY